MSRWRMDWVSSRSGCGTSSSCTQKTGKNRRRRGREWNSGMSIFSKPALLWLTACPTLHDPRRSLGLGLSWGQITLISGSKAEGSGGI